MLSKTDLKKKAGEIANNAFIPSGGSKKKIPPGAKQVAKGALRFGRTVAGAAEAEGAEAGAEVAGAEVAGEAAAVGAAELLPVVGQLVAIGGIAYAVVTGIQGIIGDDNKTREAYTQQFAQQASEKLPNYNVVVCHPQHRVAGPHVAHQHHELGMHVGTCGYDSYCSPKGQPFIFENQGDGGYLNWAYAGEFSRNGNTLTAASKLPTPKL